MIRDPKIILYCSRKYLSLPTSVSAPDGNTKLLNITHLFFTPPWEPVFRYGIAQHSARFRDCSKTVTSSQGCERKQALPAHDPSLLSVVLKEIHVKTVNCKALQVTNRKRVIELALLHTPSQAHNNF